MERDKGMAATVAPFMPSAAEIAQCTWLTEAEVDVYATASYLTELVLQVCTPSSECLGGKTRQYQRRSALMRPEPCCHREQRYSGASRHPAEILALGPSCVSPTSQLKRE
jgi:hypothetical protein